MSSLTQSRLCGRLTLRWTNDSPSPRIHALISPLLLEGGLDLWLASNQQKMAKAMVCPFHNCVLYITVIFVLLANPLPQWLWWNKLSCCDRLHMLEDGLHLIASKELRPWVQTTTKNSVLLTTTLISLEVDPSPVEPEDKTTDSEFNTWIIALWEAMKQGI